MACCVSAIVFAIVNQVVIARRVAYKLKSLEETNASTAKKWERMPRKCGSSLTHISIGGVNQWPECCTCSRKQGSMIINGEMYPTCQRVLNGVSMSRPCCTAWAIYCTEDEPWYQTMLKDECGGWDRECDEVECYDLAMTKKSLRESHDRMVEQFNSLNGNALDAKYGDVAKVIEADRQAKKDEAKSRWLPRFGIRKETTVCGCGAFQGDDAQGVPQCYHDDGKVIALVPCCLGLDSEDGSIECEESDPWIQQLRNNQTQLEQRKAKMKIAIDKTRGQYDNIDVALKRCRRECGEERKEDCVATMKEDNFQEKYERKRWRQNAEEHHAERSASDAWMQEGIKRNKRRMAERRLSETSKNSWLTLNPLGMFGVFGAQASASNNPSSKDDRQCCSCTMKWFTWIIPQSSSNICLAQDCLIYPGAVDTHACSVIPQANCERPGVSSCPAFYGHFAAGTSNVD